jgi:hypothetical protein
MDLFSTKETLSRLLSQSDHSWEFDVECDESGIWRTRTRTTNGRLCGSIESDISCIAAAVNMGHEEATSEPSGVNIVWESGDVDSKNHLLRWRFHEVKNAKGDDDLLWT